MQDRGKARASGAEPHLHLPYLTIFVVLAVPAVTLAYSLIVHAGMGGNYLYIFLSSPFNIFYEQASNGILYNYIVLLAIFALVESYSRYMADIRERDSLVDHAFVLSAVASYAASAIVWATIGTPASGTSVLAFCMLLFFVAETTDSELINRLRERHMRKGYNAEVLVFAYAALLLGFSTVFFAYLNRNQYWFIHLIGGAIFGLLLYAYSAHRKMREWDDRNTKANK